jgi:hypothetical protein
VGVCFCSETLESSGKTNRRRTGKQTPNNIEVHKSSAWPRGNQ